ncbi:hypothetical protein [Phytoactinopolyspora endophytica]|uniref:hypothetical protein n=1 Tax=Phytoactinopolyspora endophytica TaxID=1642495 RepID=UPI0013EC2E97|nr:hypothetical protein [Phytoactinopolyspora endophytica]
MTVPAFGDPAIEVASRAKAGRERADWRTWWSSLPVVERDRSAADVLAEIREEE